MKLKLTNRALNVNPKPLSALSRRVGNCVLSGLLLLFLGGCATLKAPEFTELLWPGPPLTPRIRFEGIVRNQDDLGRSAADLFSESLLGRKEAPKALQQPMGVALSNDGNRLYVTDYAKPGVFVFDFKTRRMLSFGTEVRGFATPVGIAVDAGDNVYVVDSTPRLVRVFDPSGKFLRNISHESLERPTGIAVDSKRRRIYVSDSASRGSERHVIHVFDIDGTHLRAFGGRGAEEGKLYFPTYLALDRQGNLYVTDTMNARVQAFDPQGRHIKTFGERGDAFGMFDKPKGVAIDTFGNVYVVDAAWSNVQIFNKEGDVLLFFGGRGQFPGLLFNPTDITIDRNNRIYVADAFNGRIGMYQLINTAAKDSVAASQPQPESGR